MMNDKLKKSDSRGEDQEALLELAAARFGMLTEAEKVLFLRTAAGEVANYSSSDEDKNDPAQAEDWGDDRVLRAECVAWLCADKKAADYITQRGLRIKGARIEGILDLEKVRFPHSIALTKCAVEDGTILRDSHFMNLNLSASFTGAIGADRMKLEGGLFLRNGFKALGEVRLLGANIGGNFECSNGTFVNPNERALNADGMKVEGSLFLRDGFSAQGEVRLLGATIGGNFDCSKGTFVNPGGRALSADGIKTEGSINFMNGFDAQGEVRLLGANIGGNFECSKGTFVNPTGHALNADAIKIEGSINLSNGFEAQGEVRLHGATIGGNFECSNGTFVNPTGHAINADGIKCEGDINLRNGFNAEGEVWLLGATIGGNFECSRGTFVNPDGRALSADGIKTEGSINFMNGFDAQGEVRLLGANVGGDISCIEAAFIHPQGRAINADGVSVTGNLFLGKAFKAQGSLSFVAATIQGVFRLDGVDSDRDFELDLRSAHIAVLWDEQASWPVKGKLALHGLVYDDIAKKAPTDAKTRIEWLELQDDDEYFPQPYEQLAGVLRKNGHIEDARAVLIEKENYRKKKGKLGRIEWLWHSFFGWLIDYGYSPLKALRPALIIIVLGALLFWFGDHLLAPTGGPPFSEREGIATSPYPTFNPLVYSFDTFIPIVDFHQVKYRLPNAEIASGVNGSLWHAWSGFLLLLWFWLEVGAGWVISSVLVIGVTRFVRN